MAIGQIEGTDQKGHVDPAGAQVHDCFVRRSFRHVDTDVGILFAVPRQQIVEKAASDQAMEADEQVAALFQCGLAVFTAWSSWSTLAVICRTKRLSAFGEALSPI